MKSIKSCKLRRKSRKNWSIIGNYRKYCVEVQLRLESNCFGSITLQFWRFLKFCKLESDKSSKFRRNFVFMCMIRIKNKKKSCANIQQNQYWRQNRDRMERSQSFLVKFINWVPFMIFSAVVRTFFIGNLVYLNNCVT